MKTLFVCEGFTRDSIHAQPWKHVFEIAKRMRAQGDQVSVLTNEDVGTNRVERINNLEVNRIKKGRYLFDSEQLENSLDGDFDVINWNSSGSLSAYNFLGLGKFTKKLVWTLHSGIIEFSDIQNLRLKEAFSLGQFWNNILYSIMPKVFVRKVANVRAIVTLSKRLKEYMQSMGADEKNIHVIYSGVDVNVFSPDSPKDIEKTKEALGFNNEDPIVLFYGPLSPFRGAQEIVSAIPIIQFRQPSSKFVFLGRTLKGDEKSFKIKASIQNHKQATLIEGVQDQESLVKLLSAASIIVLPFRFWPYVECPLTVLEAMAVEKPLITTAIGAIPEVVQHGVTGLVVRPKPHEVGSAVLKLLENNKLSSRLAANARIYVERYHSWDYIVEQTRETFQSCLT